MADWAWCELGDLAVDEKSAISKPYGSAIVKEDYVSAGVPVVRGVNLAHGRFHDDDFVYITPELADTMPGSRLQPGDLVFTHRGSVGQVSMVPRNPRYERYAVSTSQVKARLDSARAVPEFFYYWFRSPMGQHEIIQGSSTVGVPGLAQPVATVKKLRVPLPPLEEQRAISAVLGALDDKIESDRRAGALCLQLARVNFDEFAGHCNNERLGDVASLVLGGTPDRGRADYWTNGTIPWVNSGAANQDIILEPSELITEEALRGSAAKVMPAGASVVAITGATLGQVALLGIDTSGNQSLVGVWVEGDEVFTAWLHFALHASVNDLVRSATGAAQQHVNKGNIAELQVPVPGLGGLKDWGAQALPLMRRAVQLAVESQRLTALRDSLLPELLSGRVRVLSDADTSDHTSELEHA